MQIEISFNGSTDPKARYVGWAPVPCTIRLANPGTATAPVPVTLTSAGAFGQVEFYGHHGQPSSSTLALTLPLDGAPVTFLTGGKWEAASQVDGDASINCVETATGNSLGVTTLMVRVRKDANSLTNTERDLFVSALGRLNNQGMGGFSVFRAMHTAMSTDEAHGYPSFLPWHRAYLLDLERELQLIEPAVALPYWRFNSPAPFVFTQDFMGETVGATVEFSNTNLLSFWKTDGQPGIFRIPKFNTATSGANRPDSDPLLSEPATLLLGDPGGLYKQLLRLENNPHGSAHVSFDGFLSSIPTAARDPLFFLLHANIDRLWAKWQWMKGRFDPGLVQSFDPQGGFPGGFVGPSKPRAGHFLKDTMWPWNGVTTPPRPSTAPGGNFPTSLVTTGPGLMPRIEDVIDYQGRLNANSRLGFDYDDVPFD